MKLETTSPREFSARCRELRDHVTSGRVDEDTPGDLYHRLRWMFSITTEPEIPNKPRRSRVPAAMLKDAIIDTLDALVERRTSQRKKQLVSLVYTLAHPRGMP